MKLKELQNELEKETQRCAYWEKTAKKYQQSEKYYQQQLVDAHALLGRVVHQLSERWDAVNVTKYFPTDNLNRKKTITNPSG